MPRIVKSVEELDSLPLHAVVLDPAEGFVVVWQKTILNHWATVGDFKMYTAEKILSESSGSLIVLYM